MASDSAEELVEMRFFVSRKVFNVFDAVAKSRRVAKNKLGAEIFDEWAAGRVHESSLIQRLIRGNGIEIQTEWGELSE
jgi:hypothetical protein